MRFFFDSVTTSSRQNVPPMFQPVETEAPQTEATDAAKPRETGGRTLSTASRANKPQARILPTVLSEKSSDLCPAHRERLFLLIGASISILLQ